ncbi:histone acetyltransferase type B catalytic subunit [Phlebotomus argentipes]|uniref:histone acetyltransferase type B catalytic subunit n=1 Tax=Phlebotomus argentipes TaxID=94469 RepID=UPI00289312BE|nr:histone acetyltransferase type B catalytic subunit [Phlebotomus argentipes]
MFDLEKELPNYVAEATEALEFKLVRDPTDLEDDSVSFHPVMAHQIFGENEKIFGYKDLKVKLYYTAGPLNIFLSIDYSHKLSFEEHNITPDDITSLISEKLPAGCYYTNIDEFCNVVRKADSFQPFGEKIVQFDVKSDSGSERRFEIYFCDNSTPKFFPYHARFETFIMWYIDAASYIEQDDHRWLFFFCFEKFTNKDGKSCYASAGYGTVYQYYAYPEHVRPRISQLIVLPPFQKLGIGSRLIRTIYDHFESNKSVIDITVEDPSEDFQSIRNYIDAKLCMALPAFQREKLLVGFSKEMVAEAKAKAKINSLQCRRIYEILRLYHTNVHNEQEYRSYRLDVKKRLNMMYILHKKNIEKAEKRGVDVTAAKLGMTPITERLEQLHEEYNLLEHEYQRVIKKLKE